MKLSAITYSRSHDWVYHLYTLEDLFLSLYDPDCGLLTYEDYIHIKDLIVGESYTSRNSGVFTRIR